MAYRPVDAAPVATPTNWPTITPRVASGMNRPPTPSPSTVASVAATLTPNSRAINSSASCCTTHSMALIPGPRLRASPKAASASSVSPAMATAAAAARLGQETVWVACLARRTNHAKPRPPSPAAIPRMSAPSRSPICTSSMAAAPLASTGPSPRCGTTGVLPTRNTKVT